MQPDQLPEPAPSTIEHAPPQITHRTCPFCAELVLAAAVLCKHCGSNLTAGIQTPKAPTMSAGLKLGIFSFACFALVCLLIGVSMLLILAPANEKLIPVATWRIIVSLGMLYICWAAFKRKQWAREWMIGTGALNLCTTGWSGFQALGGPKEAQSGAMLLLGAAACAGIAAFCAYRARADFAPSSEDGSLLTGSGIDKRGVAAMVFILVVSLLVDAYSKG